MFETKVASNIKRETDIVNTDTAASRSVNSKFSWFVLTILVVSPIPFGSNRPFFWCLWASLIAAGFSFYLLLCDKRYTHLRLPLLRLTIPFVLFFLVTIQMLVQVIPLGSLAQFEYRSFPGETFLSQFLSLTPGNTFLSLLRWLTYGMWFMLVCSIAHRPHRADKILFAFAVIAAAEAVYALLALYQFDDTILLFDKTYYGGFATGTFVNRNSLATYLGLGAVVSASIAISPRPSAMQDRLSDGRGASMLRRAWACFFLVVCLAAILASQSRMGLVATLAALAAVAVLRSTRTAIAALVALSSGVLAILLFLFGGGVSERFFTFVRSLEVRTELYNQVLEMVLIRPWGGYGAGSFEYAYHLFHRPPVSTSLTWEYAHSTYLGVLADHGLPVGLLAISLVLVLAAPIARQASGKGQREAQTAAAMGASVLVGLHSTVDFSLEIEAIAIAFVTILALAYAGLKDTGPRVDNKKLRRREVGG